MITQELTDNITKLYKTEGVLWLKEIPNIIKNCQARWDIKQLTFIKNLTHNYLIAGKIKNKNIVLKIIFSFKEYERELAQLNYFRENNGIEVLDSDLKNKAILLAKAGESMEEYFPDKNEMITKEYGKFVKHNINNKLSNLYDLQDIDDVLKTVYTNTIIPDEYLSKAKLLINEYKIEERYVLHSDLHHGNLLKLDNNWVMIDPKAVYGHLAFEVGAFMINPIKHPELLTNKIIKKRSELLANILPIDIKCILAWSYIRAVLGACWQTESGLSPTTFLVIAGLFDIT